MGNRSKVDGLLHARLSTLVVPGSTALLSDHDEQVRLLKVGNRKFRRTARSILARPDRAVTKYGAAK